MDRGGGRGGVAEIQRARMIVALVEICGERGAGAVTVAHVVARSGVSRRTFYELFEDRDDCFVAAFELAVQCAARRAAPAFQGPGSWRERMRAGLVALLEFLDDEPGLGRLCVVDSLGAGPTALAQRARVVGVLIDAVDEGCREARGSARPTRLTAEGVVGAVLGVLHARLSLEQAQTAAEESGARSSGPHARRPRPMTELLSGLMAMIVLPYQGQAMAAREAARPAPKGHRAVAAHADPLREVDMRLTYRTVQVLLAIADLNGHGSGAGGAPSNREVADAAGVADQGQISKLLARLEHLGLIRNEGAGPASGEPNAWRLTPKGKAIEQTIRRQTPSA